MDGWLSSAPKRRVANRTWPRRRMCQDRVVAGSEHDASGTHARPARKGARGTARTAARPGHRGWWLTRDFCAAWGRVDMAWNGRCLWVRWRVSTTFRSRFAGVSCCPALEQERGGVRLAAGAVSGFVQAPVALVREGQSGAEWPRRCSHTTRHNLLALWYGEND